MKRNSQPRPVPRRPRHGYCKDQYFRDFVRAGDLDLSVRLGHITEEEKLLLTYYRSAAQDIASLFFNLVKSMPQR